MARRTSTPPPPEDFEEKIVGIDVEEEMQNAFLEYSYSVIYSRALPDARDGLKPVQRRILYGANELGLRPDHGHVKSQRIVGEVMGKYHPHGDQAIYDALVRMAQPFTLRLPLIDGHGNFGSLDDGPAAARYTEARMAPAALLMVGGLDEDTVDFVPNYDDTQWQPGVLPAAYPNLLVNGAAGIAVGMATNMAPHNLVEVIGAARHLIAHPTCSLEDLMKFVPGPDLPCGGKIVGLEGIRDAYLTGRGSFRTRATSRVEALTPRRKGIVVTELPYLVGPEKVIDKVKDLVQSKRLQGIADLKDLSDRQNGLRLVIEIKNGFHPEAVLEQLYRLTPMEENFGINNVALVDGQPRTMGLKELLRVYVDFRTDVVRRRSEHRLRKREERLHLVEGLLIAIVDIDEVIQVIRTSDDADVARTRLMDVFDLTETQATYILELRLRRLTKFSLLELETEKSELERAIEALRALLADEKLLLKLVSDELAEVAKAHGTPRRTVLLESSGHSAAATAGSPLEVSDDPCWVLLSSTGLLARTGSADPIPEDGGRSKHDVIVGAVRTTARGHFGLATSAGRMIRLSALDLPTLPPTNGAPSLSGGAPLAAYVDLPKGEEPVTIAPIGADAPVLALGTAGGVVKRVTPEAPRSDDWSLIGLRDGDHVVGAAVADRDDVDLVFVTSDAQLLRFSARAVRPQGRSAGGMAGIKLAPGATVAFFGVVDPAREGVVVTASGSSNALPGHAGRLAQGHAVRRVPAEGARHRRSPLPPLPARRGHARAVLRRQQPCPCGCGQWRGRGAAAGRGPTRWLRSAVAHGDRTRRATSRQRDRMTAPRTAASGSWSASARSSSVGSSPEPSPASPPEPPPGSSPRSPADSTQPAPTGLDEHPSTAHGSPADDACSVQWDHDGTSAFGTAATAGFFVIVEQSGPWGRDAARESHLDPQLGAELDARSQRGRGRFMLVRRPGGHPAHEGPRRVLLAHAGAAPDRPAWLLEADIADPVELLGLDWGALARGSRALVGASLPGARDGDPTLLVCTNGRRDVCCAVRGRPLAAAAARAAPGRVWEVSHTGGHRFAPTAVLLPWGQTYARLDEHAAAGVLQASLTGHTPAELLGPSHDRGRSPLAAPAQCAESHVRATLGETRLDSLWAGAPTPSTDGDDVVVTHADGRRWLVHVTRVPTARVRPESCGKKGVDVLEHRATTVTQL